MHPVRDTGSASNKDSVKDAAKARTKKDNTPKLIAEHTALCLLKNPRPPRPSFDCPFGCPHHLQRTCPKVNCIWGDPKGTYVHLAAQQCMSKCHRLPDGCPYDMSFGYEKDDGHGWRRRLSINASDVP